MKVSIKYLIIGLIVFLFYSTEFSAVSYNFVCFGLILLVGIPHGAADHRISSTIYNQKNTVRFIIKYILIASGYAVWWIFMPGKALAFFILLSTYHFGQEFLEDMGLKKIRPWAIILWGSTLLIAPVFIAYPEIKSNLEMITNSDLPEINKVILISFVSFIFICAFFHLIHLSKNGQIKRKRVIEQTFKVLIFFISFSVLPFIIAFTLYFILFHALNAFRHQFNWLKGNIHGYTIKRFLKDLLLFSSLSIFGILTLIYFIQPESSSEMLSYFFVIISIITLPHSILFDQFYKNRNAQLQKQNESESNYETE